LKRRSGRRLPWLLITALVIVLVVIAAGRLLPNIVGMPSLANTASTPKPGSPAGKMIVSVLDVGQGDSILVRTPAGQTILIDGGPPGAGLPTILKSAGVSTIELLVVTHPDADHIGGLPATIQQFPVKEVWTSGSTSTSTIFEDLIDAITASGAKYQEVTRGGRAVAGDVQITVLNPGPNLAEDTNENSVVLRMQYKEISFLFTGDAGSEAEAQMVQSGETLRSTVLKVGHHGSTSSSTMPFLRAVRPAVAIWSAGRNNDYGHPHQETVANLQAMGTKIYGTALNGTVTATTDGSALWVTTSADGQTVDITGGGK
jgi:competence protein ComEC